MTRDMYGINLSLPLFDLALSGLKFSLCECAPDFVRRKVIAPFQGWAVYLVFKSFVFAHKLLNGYFLARILTKMHHERGLPQPKFYTRQTPKLVPETTRSNSAQPIRQVSHSKSYEYKSRSGAHARNQQLIGFKMVLFHWFLGAMTSLLKPIKNISFGTKTEFRGNQLAPHFI